MDIGINKEWNFMFVEYLFVWLKYFASFIPSYQIDGQHASIYAYMAHCLIDMSANVGPINDFIWWLPEQERYC